VYVRVHAVGRLLEVLMPLFGRLIAESLMACGADSPWAAGSLKIDEPRHEGPRPASCFTTGYMGWSVHIVS